jgi:hypothetical protein
VRRWLRFGWDVLGTLGRGVLHISAIVCLALSVGLHGLADWLGGYGREPIEVWAELKLARVKLKEGAR